MEKEEEKIFSVSSKAYSRPGKRTVAMPGTVFLPCQPVTKSLSRFNNDDTGRKKYVFSPKITAAIVDIPKTNWNIYKATANGKNWLIGCFDNTQTGHCYVAFEVEDFMAVKVSSFLTSNIWTHNIFLMVLASRLVGKEKEATKTLAELDFSGPVIDSNQQDSFVKLSDNIFQATKGEGNIDGMEPVLGTVQEIGDMLKAMNFEDVINVNPLLNDSMAVCDSAMKIGFDNSIPMMEKSDADSPKKAAKASQMRDDVLSGKCQVFKDAKGMTPTLATGFIKARNAFKRNGPLLEPEEIMQISQMANGDLKVLCLTGPSGTGKTTLAETYAGALGLPFVKVSGSEGMEEASLVGMETLIAQDGISVMQYRYSPFIEAFRDGGVVLFDELNTVSPGVLEKLNPILDGSGFIVLDNGEVIEQNENFRFICAMNIGAGFEGTQKLNKSLVNRFQDRHIIRPYSWEKAARIIEVEAGFKNDSIVEIIWRIKNFADACIKESGDEDEQEVTIRNVIAWIKKAKYTDEFVESSVTTFMTGLTFYDSNINDESSDYLTEQTSNVIAAQVMERIQAELSDCEYVNMLEKD